MDFTIGTYRELLKALIAQDYYFQTFGDFLENPEEKAIILRHDVDARNKNSLEFALIQQDMGIRGSYYFRIVPQSYDKRIIQEIARQGHEIGYHYEDMDLAYRDIKNKSGKKIKDSGDPELLKAAIISFEKNLANLREAAPVKTICMHGSPLSPHDNKLLWTKYNYRDYGIIGEPYFDMDLAKCFI